MSQRLTLELSDEVYAALQKQASAVGLSVAELAIASLHQSATYSNTDVESKEARQRLLQYAGAVSLGYATSADNESIDADLAKAYADNF